MTQMYPIAKEESRQPLKIGKTITDAQREQILDTYVEFRTAKQAAQELGLKEWQVRKVIAQIGDSFILNLAHLDFLEYMHALLEKGKAIAGEADARWVLGAVTQTAQALVEMGRPKGIKGTGTIIQNVVNLTTEEERRLKQTAAEIINGEIIDSDPPS